RGLGHAGAKIVLNGRNPETMNKAVENLREEGIYSMGYCFDVTKKDEVRVAIEEIEGELGKIDILINNAGIQKRAPFIDIDEVQWQEVLNINLKGAFLTSQQVARGMTVRKSGKIINICSLMSEVGRATIVPYTVAKGGLKMLTRAMAVELGKYNIQVNGIGPGYFVTEMTKNLKEDPRFDEWIKQRTPAGRWGDPEELVGTAIFLASSASDFINGQIIYVDGGVLASL
ncbi:MAG: gluconate 5-dehydrogenase, partial [Spirochaetes bacterium]